MQREAMEFDVVVVGAGPAGLAAAIRLKQQAAAAGSELSVCVLEKGSEVGAHILSGAVIDPVALDGIVSGLEGARRAARDPRAGRPVPGPDRGQGAPHPELAAAPADGQPRHVHREPRQRLPLARPACRRTRRRGVPGLRGRRSAVQRRRLGQGRRDRRHGHRQERRAQGLVRAGHGTAREVHAVRRGLPRLAVAAADVEVQPARRRRPAGLRHRHQGALAGAEGEAPARTRRAQPGLAAAERRRRRLVPLSLWRRPDLGRLRDAPELREPAPLAVRGDAAVQDPPGDPRLLRGRQAPGLRRARHQRRRPAVDPEAHVPGRRADRLHRGFREPAAHQGLAQRDEDRHARGRSGVRGGRRRVARTTSSRPTRKRSATPGRIATCTRCAT